VFWSQLAAASTRQKVVFLALLAAALGSLMPWFSGSIGDVTINRAGISYTAGWLTLAAGIIGAAAVLVAAGAIRLEVEEVVPAAIELLAAAACVIIALLKWDDSVTYGLLAVLGGGAVAAFVAPLEVRDALAVRRARPRVIVPDAPAKATELPRPPAALPPGAHPPDQPAG
jgi:hypothetical protein